MNGKRDWARLGVNIDHVATLRQLRGTPYPSLIEAARLCEEGGAEQITVHLREDRRHIQDQDVIDLSKHLKVPLNLEMACSDSVLKTALKVNPDWVCLVPEKRQEVTTEGGLNLKGSQKKLTAVIGKMKKRKAKISLFIEPSVQAVRLSHELGADAVEFHTGHFCGLTQVKKTSQAQIKKELKRIEAAALEAKKLGMGAHAGHGIDYQNIRLLVELRAGAMPLLEEFNIGHALVCRASMVGMKLAVREMVSAIAAP